MCGGSREQGLSTPSQIPEALSRERIPLNEAKRLVGATRGYLQGGVLDGRKGWHKLAGEKQADLLSLGMSMLTLFDWREFEIRHFVGKAAFGCCFRRPLLSLWRVSLMT